MSVKTKVSVLAFEKKLVPSDGYLYGCTWEKKYESEHVKPLLVRSKSVRGTISNRLSKDLKNNEEKLNDEVAKANIQTVDTCSLSPEQDTLKLEFTLKVLPGIEVPSACSNQDFMQTYQAAVKSYIEKDGFEELAHRYAYNLANGRFLWRNRLGASQIHIHITDTQKGNSWTFDTADTFSLKEMKSSHKDVLSLGKRIAGALSGAEDFLILNVETYAQIGKAQEVYPSEELIMHKTNTTGKKSKTLYSVNNCAALHSQKIGNALRTIDTWYPDYEKVQRPIAVETYGSVTNMGIAYRNPKTKVDFYTLFDKWARGDALKEIEQEHYVMAVLVRGGVFGDSK